MSEEKYECFVALGKKFVKSQLLNTTVFSQDSVLYNIFLIYSLKKHQKRSKIVDLPFLFTLQEGKGLRANKLLYLPG